MTMLHTAARKLVLPALLLVLSAFLILGAVNVWTTWRETEALMISLQREKAEAAAVKIYQYLAMVEQQFRPITRNQAPISPERRLYERFEYLRVQREIPAITEICHLNAEGQEVLLISRLVYEGRSNDFSGDIRFTEALKRGKYVGPLYVRRESEPYVWLAIAHTAPNPEVTMAELNIKWLWDIIDTIKVGETGYAYVVDGEGRLMASRDTAQLLR